MDIYSKEKETENPYNSNCFCRSEIVLCEVSGGEKESETDKYARDDLGDERVCDQGFEPCPILLYDEFREEKIEALSESKVVIYSKESDKA